MQGVIVVPLFPTLLEHPDFQEGLGDGQECFREGMFEEDQEKTWTEDEIIQFIGEELSERKYRRDHSFDQALGLPSCSYLHHLGFVIGYLDQVFAAKAQ